MHFIGVLLNDITGGILRLGDVCNKNKIKNIEDLEVIYLINLL